MSAAECGLACVAMVSQYYGHHAPLRAIRDHLRAGLDGTTAADLVALAEVYGLKARAVSVDASTIHLLRPASVMHWSGNHFVVFERYHDGVLEIVDPATGRRRVRVSDPSVAGSWVALEFLPTEKFVRARRVRSRLRRYVATIVREHPLAVATILSSSLLLQLLMLSVPIVSRTIIDWVVSERRSVGVISLVGVVVALCIVHAFVFSLRARAMIAFRRRLNNNLSTSFTSHLLRLSLRFLRLRPPGDLIQRIQSLSQIRDLLAHAAVSLVFDVGLIAFYTAALFWIDTTLALAVCASGLLILSILAASRGTARLLAAEYMSRETGVYAVHSELVHSLETIKRLGIEEAAYTRWNENFAQANDAYDTKANHDARIDAVIGALRFGTPAVITLICSQRILGGEMTLGDMFAGVSVSVGVIAPLASLVAMAHNLSLLSVHLDRLDDVREEPPEASGTVVPSEVQSIEFRNVSFRHSADAPWIIKDVSFSISSGEYVALAGASGSGKSTITALIAGIYLDYHGEILVNGKDLRLHDLSSLRRGIAYVSQDIHLFRGTLAYNISLGRAIPEACLIEAARHAQIHEFIMSLPYGYETPIIDIGTNMSAGQRQRIAIARAFAAGASMLVMDEATNCLDSPTEQAIQDFVRTLRCTRIVISHRASAVGDADRALVLADARIVEDGRPSDLHGGMYTRLFRQRSDPRNP